MERSFKIEDRLAIVWKIGAIFLSLNDRFIFILEKNRCLGTMVVLISPHLFNDSLGCWPYPHDIILRYLLYRIV